MAQPTSHRNSGMPESPDTRPTAELWEAKPRTHCPSCGTVLELTVRCTATAILPAGAAGPRVAKEGDTPRRASHEQAILDAAQRAGLLEPFYQTVRYVKRDQTPKDLEAFFLTFLKGLTQRLIPAYAMAAFNALFDRAPLEYHTAQSIGVVVVNGYMRLFVPNGNVVGTKLRRLQNQESKSRKALLKIDDGAQKLDEWIHTRWGYVAGKGALYEQLRNRAFGEFARPRLDTLNIPRT